VGSASFDTKNGNPSSEDPVSAVTGLLTGQTSSTGSITGTWAFDSANTGGEIDWSGFQLDVATTAAVPAPLIGRGLPVLLALAGLLFCAELLERNKRRSLSLLPPRV
jgi:hypothetical protein